MLLVFLVVTVLLGASCAENVLEQERETREDYSAEDRVVTCVTRLLRRHYGSVGQLTYVEIGYGDEHLLRAVHSQTLLSIIYRKVTVDYHIYNEGYLFTTNSAANFAQNFPHLAREPTWNAHVKIIIVVKRVEEDELREIFDVLMRSHVVNVVVVNWLDLSLYTYNPYENYGCGKYYNRIIHFGSCPTVSVDLFPDKLITRLRGCMISVAVAHTPPYAINPSRIRKGMFSKGVEQYALEIAAEKEQFNITYTYIEFSENYSTFTNNMTVLGPLSMVQNGDTDMMIGAVVLSAKRAAVFDYISSHLNLVEEVRGVVKKASAEPAWKYFYIEFEYSVWVVLLVSIGVVGVFVIFVLKIRDRSYVFIVLVNTLVMHGVYKCDYGPRWAIKCLGIFWLWFAYLVNCFYQANLSSLTTKPGYEPQISNEHDLHINNIKPCVSTMIITLLHTETNVVLNDSDPNCILFFDSIRTVSKSDDKFTFVLYSWYAYQKYEFYDEYGDNLLYVFDHVLLRLSYAMFMYKGFPLKHSLYKTMIRLRENGLIEYHRKLQNGLMKYTKINCYKYKQFKVKLIVPWYLFNFGIFVSFIVLVVEVISYVKSTGMN